MTQPLPEDDAYVQAVRQILHRLAPPPAAIQTLAALVRDYEAWVRNITLGGSAALSLVVAAVMIVLPHDLRSDVVAALVTLVLAVLAFVKPKLKTVSEAALQKAWGGKPLPAPYIKLLQELANGERALQEQWITLWGAIMVFAALLVKWIA